MYIPLIPAVEQGAPSIRGIIHTWILYYTKYGRNQQHTGTQQPQHSLTGQQGKIPQSNSPILHDKPQEKVDHTEYNLSHEEIIVHKTAGKNQQSKHTAALGGHVLIQGPKQQREYNNRLVEMVKEDIIHRKTGECIEHPAQDRIVRCADITL